MIGAGPSGLVAAKHAIEAGFEVSVFEAGDDLGGQWRAGTADSGIWPGMRTNTSRSMTAFSDFPHPPDFPLHPDAGQIHGYLRAYADHFGVTGTIRCGVRVNLLEPGERGDPGRQGWRIDREPFDAVVIASGRFRRPHLPPSLGTFGVSSCMPSTTPAPSPSPTAEPWSTATGSAVTRSPLTSRPRRPVVSAYRKPRYVLQKVVEGVPSDWQWYTQFGAWEREALPANEFGRLLLTVSSRSLAIQPTSGRPNRSRTSSSPDTRCPRTTWPRSPEGADHLPSGDHRHRRPDGDVRRRAA